MKHLKVLRKYFWKYRVRLVAGLFFITVSNYFSVLPPQLTSFVVEKVQNILQHTPTAVVRPQTDGLVNWFVEWTNNWKSLSTAGIVALCGLAILLLALIRGLFMFFMRQTIIVMSRHVEFDQKNEVYEHYQKLDTQFYKTHSTGDLMNRISEDVSRVRMYAGPAIMYLFNLITTIIFCVVNMLASDVKLTLYVLAPLPILAFTIYYVNTIIHRKSEKIQGLLSDLTTNAQQSYSGIRVIKSYVQEKAMLDFFEKNSDDYRKNAIGLAKVESVYFPSMTLLIGISTLLTIMIGGVFIHENNAAIAAGLAQPHPGVNAGVMVAFIMYITMLTFPVSAIGWVASMIQRASASQKRINEFLQTRPNIESPAVANQTALQGHITFKDLSFTYPHTGIQALKHIQLDILPGQRIAVIGKTGSGKSTIAQLLLRTYDASSGSLELDGTAIQQFDLQALRKQVSYVPQDVFLFSDTVENNIKFGNEKASHEQAVTAAQMASVASEIDRFELGYQTVVGERGVTLSGGQKQRLSIARALLKPSPIVIFDDCLSAVDARTEKEVLKNLDQQLKGKTAIIITHRIFSLLNFDNIIVLEDGQIVETGTHDSLMALNGTYAELYNLQQEEESVDVK